MKRSGAVPDDFTRNPVIDNWSVQRTRTFAINRGHREQIGQTHEWDKTIPLPPPPAPPRATRAPPCAPRAPAQPPIQSNDFGNC